ncbi:MAG: cupin domain-containing protein [Betaproteobacteria bacterium]|jgi:anti-sigma factor ChrR (cupin superfamily)|nr:cupin domain-containing protein [Betaproteobacteria bacterium]
MQQTITRLHDDFAQRVVAHAAEAQWSPSPQAGVERRMLDRVGAEVGRATSIVRYAPGSAFSPHRHDGGEEILVLDGVFSDEHGDYPAGTYLRNPPGTAHRPHSRPGCTIFVKLWQFAPGDTEAVCLDTRQAEWHRGLVPGLSVLPLHEHDGISSALVRWAPHTHFNPHMHPGGEEILVLEGVFHDEDGEYPAGSWLRNPRWSRHTPYTDEEGALIYVKVGHLGATLLIPDAQ